MTLNACVVFFDSLHLSQSIFSTKMNLLHHSNDTRANDMKRWKTTINANLLHDQISSSFSQFFVSRRCVNILFCSEFAANQNASINKNSKSSNSRSLKQHTFAKSISFFCFCFCSAREIDRFIILICRYLSHQFDKIFNKIFILVIYIYFSSSRTFSAFEFISSRLSHLLWNFQRQSWSDRYLNFSQWISLQCRSIEEMNIRFETKFEKNEEIMLRACLKSRLKIYLINESSYEN